MLLNYPDIDPIALTLGPLQVRWYGLMYLVGFLGGWWLARRRARLPGSGWTDRQIDDLVFYLVLGVVLGGRLGYVLFYQADRWLDDPLYLLRVWEGGMSFHGGLVGVMAAMFLLARRFGKPFFAVADFVAPLTPLGLGAGRIGNFINGELWGRAVAGDWGVRLPCGRFPEYCTGSAWSAPVHPSQLYEAFLEGVVLFVVLWFFSRRPRPTMAVSGLFLLGYGLFRFLVEFVRQPDAHLGYLAFGWLTMGQVLSLPMLAGGLVMLGLGWRQKPVPGSTS